MRFPSSLHRSSPFCFVLTLLAAQPAVAADWQNGVDYGGGSPTMDLYVPDAPEESPGIIVALHFCGGTSQNAHGWFQGLADEHGFLIITPDVGAGKDCWDAAPGRSGERADIANMVDFVINQEGANASRVFAAGASSGACMTQALLASYPEVFAAGSVLAGVPAGAWTTGNGCCGSTAMRSAEEWGDIVRMASPDFNGARPRIQLFHGTADSILPFSHLGEAEKQWTNVHGVSEVDQVVGAPGLSGWDKTLYADSANRDVVEVNVGEGKPHDLTPQGLWSDVVRFFGLDMDAPPDSGTGGADAGTGGAETGTGGGDSGSGGADAGTGGSDVGAGGTPVAGIGGAFDPIGTGGTSASGGASAAGGDPTMGSGGATTPGEASTRSGSSGDSGSGCQMKARSRGSDAWWVTGAALLVLVRRRRPAS